jgi:hypothetical protein
MGQQYDFREEWEKTKKKLLIIGKNAVKAAQKGEEELKKLPQIGKMHLDSTTANLKKEHLYYLIGKEYVERKVKCDCPSSQLKKLLDEVKSLEREQKSIGRKLKQRN